MTEQFIPGIRVRWLLYSHDKIVINGGCGTVIDVKVYARGSLASDISRYIILKDGGEIEEFSHHDLDLLEYEEPDNEN